jgi:hypothetical protein
MTSGGPSARILLAKPFAEYLVVIQPLHGNMAFAAP